MVEFDPAYIQAQEHRSKSTQVEAENVPVIDLSLENTDERLVSKIGGACEEHGFFQVINHGVSSGTRRKLESAAREFFAMPAEEKMKVRRDEENPLGYYDTEHTKNVRDWKEVFDFTIENPTVVAASHEVGDGSVKELVNQWPHFPLGFREASEEYAQEVEKLCYKLLELISLSLGLEAERLNGYFKDQTSFIRLNHYPPCPNPRLALGVGRHKDAGALTVLSQDDVGGLEVKRKSDGEWTRIKPTPDAFIVNVGDIIQVWSNDKYESVEHRVIVNSERDRLSIPFFFNPSHYTMVEPLEELINKEYQAKYRAYSWGKFFATRKQSNFKKLDVENIQIYDFKV